MGVGVGLSDWNCIYYDQLNVSDSAKGNITNDTFRLEISVLAPDGTHSIRYNYSVSNGTGNLSLQSDVGVHHIPGIEINTNETDINYTFEIRWLVNSADPEILGLRLLGEDNRVTGSFHVNESWGMHLTLDPRNSEIVQVEPDHYSEEQVIVLPFDIRIQFRVWILCVD